MNVSLVMIKGFQSTPRRVYSSDLNEENASLK